jgi:hypothetical protein
MVGTSCRYAPVIFPGDMSQRKQFVDIIAGPANDGHIIAASVVPVPSPPITARRNSGGQ